MVSPTTGVPKWMEHLMEQGYGRVSGSYRMLSHSAHLFRMEIGSLYCFGKTNGSVSIL